MQLTENFSLEELTHSDYATRKNISNSPDDNVQSNLLVLAQGLERVRDLLGVPLHINSGYRSPKLNAALGGAKFSAHMTGLAADFIAPKFGTPLEICRFIEKYKDQVGFEKLIFEGTWAHISFPDEGEPKYEILTAHFGNGPTTYTRGLA